MKFRVLEKSTWKSWFKFMLTQAKIYCIQDSRIPEIWTYGIKRGKGVKRGLTQMPTTSICLQWKINNHTGCFLYFELFWRVIYPPKIFRFKKKLAFFRVKYCFIYISRLRHIVYTLYFILMASEHVYNVNIVI